MLQEIVEGLEKGFLGGGEPSGIGGMDFEEQEGTGSLAPLFKRVARDCNQRVFFFFFSEKL